MFELNELLKTNRVDTIESAWAKLTGARYNERNGLKQIGRICDGCEHFISHNFNCSKPDCEDYDKSSHLTGYATEYAKSALIVLRHIASMGLDVENLLKQIVEEEENA